MFTFISLGLHPIISNGPAVASLAENEQRLPKIIAPFCESGDVDHGGPAGCLPMPVSTHMQVVVSMNLQVCVL